MYILIIIKVLLIITRGFMLFIDLDQKKCIFFICPTPFLFIKDHIHGEHADICISQNIGLNNRQKFGTNLNLFQIIYF